MMAEETKVPGAIGNSDLVLELCFETMFDPDVTDDCILFTIISYLKLFESYEGSINN